ncbi:MAG: hypothetical protein ACI8PP_001601 [Candidatus Pseudothioglobus sp.]|jgi:hypothetical protein
MPDVVLLEFPIYLGWRAGANTKDVKDNKISTREWLAQKANKPHLPTNDYGAEDVDNKS